MENHYKVLGLKRGASLKEISAAYRSQALIHHPDKRKSNLSSSSSSPQNSDEIFFKIKAAYQALQDPKTRAELDLQLIGQEERVRRDAQMTLQRKTMRDELLSRERSHAVKVVDETSKSTTTTAPSKTSNLINEDACLRLKCKYPENISKELATEMIKSSLKPFNLLDLHTTTNNLNLVAEFKDSQSAYQALCSSNDLIVKADWYKGYPPSEGVNLNFASENTKKKAKIGDEAEKLKYSKDLEVSILDKLRQKKRDKMNNGDHN